MKISPLELSQIILPGGRGLMAMIGLYADDSSGAKQEDFISVGAILGWPADLLDASWKWESVLKKHNLDYFKASECEALRGQFGFLSDRKFTLQEARQMAAAIRGEFVEVIRNAATLDGIGITLGLRDFKRVLENNALVRHFVGLDPLIVLYRRLITATIDLLVEDFGKHHIAFVFDGHSKWRLAEAEYDSLRMEDAVCERMMGSVGHGDDKDHMPLQMADLLAYEARKNRMIEEGAEPRESFTQLTPAWRLLGTIGEKEILSGLERYLKTRG